MIWYDATLLSTPSSAKPGKTVLVATESGPGTGDVICTYKDRYGNRWKETRSWSEMITVPMNDSAQVLVIRSAAPAAQEFDFDFDPRKYWSPPPPPTNPTHLPSVREDRRMKRVVIRPEFHARSNPRPKR